jgi:hypothetical protein
MIAMMMLVLLAQMTPAANNAAYSDCSRKAGSYREAQARCWDDFRARTGEDEREAKAKEREAAVATKARDAKLHAQDIAADAESQAIHDRANAYAEDAKADADEIAMRDPKFEAKAWKSAFCFWGDYARAVDRQIAEQKAIAKDVHVVDLRMMHTLGLAHRQAIKHYNMARLNVRKGKKVVCTRELIEDEARLEVDDREPIYDMGGLEQSQE